ncbi:uncharacterized protein LOC135848846 [Planococcus citri]|uniref:uncharacterized protein LOC135848846 n=1 Tax=Planococcus citri TaxID=170843 RepID=UPI0031F9F08D
MGWMKKCIPIALFVITILSYVKCDGELVIIHQPPIVNFYDERPLFVTELKYVFGTCLGYLQGKSAEWQDLHLSAPFDFFNIVFMVAVVPGVETLNVTGAIRIPLIEDDHLNITYDEINLETTTTFKHCTFTSNGKSQRFDLPKINVGDSDTTSSSMVHKFHEKIEADMQKPATNEGPHIYWGECPKFDEKDPEYLEAAHMIMSTSMKSLAEMVKEPRKPLIALITHTGKITLTR